MKLAAPTPQPNRQVVAEASAWFVDFRAGDLDAAARDRFGQWLRRSPEHIQAYLEVAGAWAGLPAGDPQGRIDIEELVARAHAAGNVVPLEDAAIAASAPQAKQTSVRRFAVAASVGIVAVTAALGAWIYGLQNPSYATQIGDQRSIALSDGSSVELNARSKVRIQFDEQGRNIELLEGQALFRVAQDPLRPFVVRSGGTQVRALGTRFDVYRRRTDTVVTVLEGQVAVGSAAKGSTAVIAAGEQTVVTVQTVARPRRADVAAATAWTQKQLMFEETPLAEVAEEFNRYNLRPLVIADPQLRSVTISGVYSSTDPASLLRFLRDQPAIGVTESRDEITIRRKPVN